MYQLFSHNILKLFIQYCLQIYGQRSHLRLLQLFSLVTLGILSPSVAHALSQSNVSITFATDPLLVSDSNNCSGGAGPRAAYVGFKVTNTSGATLNNLQANLTGFATGFALAGGQPANQYIGTLAAGASRTVYWYISYPCHTSTATSITLTMTVSDANPGVATATQTVTSNSSISANAGGLIASTPVLGAGAVVGQIITYDVTYEFGNVSGPQGAQLGDRFNLQPSGSTNFNAGCLQLQTSRIESSGVNAISAGTVDRLFFTATANQGGSGNRVTVRYFFLYRCNGVTTTANPYAAQTSGSNNIKYTGNYGTSISFPSASNPFSITKTASQTSLPTGGTVTYTVTITNTSTFPALIDRIVDTLPAGVTYGALAADSDVTAANSSSTPTTGATGTITWIGIPFTSYSIPANGSIKLKYTVNIPNIINTYSNSVSVTSGQSTIGPATAIVDVGNIDNPNLSANFCNPNANLLFILDDSESVDSTEVQQQRNAVMETLRYLVANNITARAAMVGFDSVGRTVINYTDVTAANLPTFQNALNTNYGTTNNTGSGWEKGLQQAVSLGVSSPDAVFFFTDGTEDQGGNPIDEAVQFKAAGKHIYGIGIDGVTLDAFRGISDRSNTLQFNGSNATQADYVQVTNYATLLNEYGRFFATACKSIDYGDAPDSYGTDNTNNSSEGIGARHTMVSGLYLGNSIADPELTGIPATTGNLANSDDLNNASDDEDGISNFPTLTTTSISYSVTVKVNNTSGSPAYLIGWLDFNRNGIFEVTEGIAVTQPILNNTINQNITLTWINLSGLTAGTTYARFRISNDLLTVSTATGLANGGEVEDYSVAIATASQPNILLVKRITAINGNNTQNPNDNTPLNTFIDATGTDDNNPNWPNPNTYLKGAINGGFVKPGDEIEYTIYFLNTQNAAQSVTLCDPIPANQTFVATGYNIASPRPLEPGALSGDTGIGLALDSTTLPTNPTFYLTNENDSDRGRFFLPNASQTPPACTSNNNGAVVVNIVQGATQLPAANTPGNPSNSYGFIRFKAKVN